MTGIAGTVTTIPIFISDLNKSNDDKFLYLAGSLLQNCAGSLVRMRENTYQKNSE